MVLVDTSVWISHLRIGEPDLEILLNNGNVICHPFIIGELACGNLANRAEILSLLQALPRAECAGDEEVLYFIEKNHLMGRGIGYIDAHLLASAVLTDTPIWTFDIQLQKTAFNLGLRAGTHE